MVSYFSLLKLGESEILLNINFRNIDFSDLEKQKQFIS